DFAPEIVRLDRNGAAVLPENPRRELRGRRVLRDEHTVVELAGVPVGAIHPPGGVAGELDAGFADKIADLPGRPPARGVDVEIGRDPEVSFAPRGEADVAADARDTERPDVLAVEILTDQVPAPVVREQPVWIDGTLALTVSRDRVVRELDRALL